MTVTVRQLATWVEGEVVGDGERVISNARPLNEARSGDITFVEDEKYMSAWHDSHAAAAVVNSSVPVNGRPLIWFDNAATTQKPQAVIDRISYFYQHENSNIHRAAHELAARATDAWCRGRSESPRAP